MKKRVLFVDDEPNVLSGLRRMLRPLHNEWTTEFARYPAGPTQLVRPTLEANKRAQPDVMKTVLTQGWGTQCTKNPDGTLSKECKIH